LQADAQKTGNALRPFGRGAGGAFKGSGPEFSKTPARRAPSGRCGFHPGGSCT